ncbi:MAG: tRNA pseudouridine(55) synthase TruB [Holosporaceae bacterium]|nr:MAG: tRNA pseudouridine(55) synthase TruB [Holosporaceae bacterium]
MECLQTKRFKKSDRISGVQRGHVGTLDPLATGFLPIALGDATKTIPYLEKATKTYAFEATWGAQTTTDDKEGDVLFASDVRPTRQLINETIPHFVGEIHQVPPIYSAIKMAGQPAYEKARRGEMPQMEKRLVVVHKLSLVEITNQTALFHMTCGSGVFVRSLVRDMAIAMGTVGHVSKLRRVQVGPFLEKDMVSLEKILEIQGDSGVKEHMHPLDVVLDDIPVVVLEDDLCVRFRFGQRILFDQMHLPVSRGDVLCREQSGKPVGFAEVKDFVLYPKRLFNC